MTRHDSVGRYAIYGKIASGGMATVHFGRLTGAAGFSRIVAIKRLHPHLAGEPDFLSTIIDEARLVARIHHPNVVQTLDVVADDGELLVVMEYVRGEALSRLLQAESARRRRVPLPIASAIAIGVLQGLHAAHEATSERGEPLEIVHRDVSPQNVLVGVDGQTRVIDFGIAKATRRLQTTNDGVVKGKVSFMPPEQILGGEISRKADIYSMGVVLWEMLTGHKLFVGEDMGLCMSVLRGAAEPPSRYAPHLPPELDEIVMTALAPDARRRFGTAAQMAKLLGRVLAPALPSDVGAWVEVVARGALARRAEMLREIEGHSGVVAIAPQALPASAQASTTTTAPLTTQVTTPLSELSSLAIETPKLPMPAVSPRRHLLGAASGLLMVAAAAAGALLIGVQRPSASMGSLSAATSAPEVVAPPPERLTPVAPSSSASGATPAMARPTAHPARASKPSRPKAATPNVALDPLAP
jgi:serine/threonine protein kinase